MVGTGDPQHGGGKLSIVATPIGNMEDITLRALRVLGEADRILAEDTRRTRTLCKRHSIETPLSAYHAHSSEKVLENLLQELEQGKHLALVSDAGMPVVSDPGAELIRGAAERGLPVEVIPGASAVTSAVALCGLRAEHFRFEGFLPRGGKRRRQALERLAQDSGAGVLFESPSRLAATLQDLSEVLPAQRQLAVCRELTKLHEEVMRGTAAELAQRVAEGVKGEITLVIEADGGAVETDLEDLDRQIRARLAAGLSVRDTVAEMQGMGLARSKLYARVQAIHEEPSG